MIKSITYMLNLVLLIVSTQFAFAESPDWEDCPECYEFTAVMNALVDQDGIAIADDGDMLAAFDTDGTVRGLGTQQNGFGTTEGQIIYEIIMRSNAGGDVLTFQYYDASEDAILVAAETYTFEINGLVGTIVSPFSLNVSPPDFSCPECTDNDAGVAPFTCADAVASFGCDFLWGGSLISDSCPATCGTCPEDDVCGVCDGDGSSCADCAGTPNGDATEDCSGTCNGDSWVSDCGCVAASNDGNDCYDCAGVPNGDSWVSD